MPPPALADAIDGSWCFQSSSLTILGPAIRTPGGSNITGDYDRHGFRYTIPPGEPAAGASVVMVLLNDEVMELTATSAGVRQPTQTWRRCKPVS